MSTGALEALSHVLDRGGEADDVLRSVVEVLAGEPGVEWAAIAFLEEGELVVGPEAGVADASRRTRTEILFQGSRVGELWIDGGLDASLRTRVAALVSAHVLIGWDTGGTPWEA